MDAVSRAADFQARASALAEAKQAANPRSRSRLRPSLWQNMQYPASIVAAFALGLFAVFLSRYIRYHLQGGSLSGEDTDLIMMIDGGLAAGAGFAIRQIFRFKAKVFITAHTFGVGAMILSMHNFVHYAPETFATLLSPDWVRQVVTDTPPNSIIFRDMVFTSEPVAASGDSGFAPICGFETYMPLSDGEFSEEMQQRHNYCFE